MEGVNKSERTFIVLMLKKHELIDTHIDHTCNISLKGGKEFMRQEARKEAAFGLLTSASQRSTHFPWNTKFS